MATRYQLFFEPCDALENSEFEAAIQSFASTQPPAPVPPVYARYDSPHGRWLLSFETRKTLQAFRDFWHEQTERADIEEPGEATA